jgi:hypothetical protein
MIVVFIFYGVAEAAVNFIDIPTLLVRAKLFFSTQQRPGWLWDPPRVLSNGYRRFSQGV